MDGAQKFSVHFKYMLFKHACKHRSFQRAPRLPLSSGQAALFWLPAGFCSESTQKWQSHLRPNRTPCGASLPFHPFLFPLTPPTPPTLSMSVSTTVHVQLGDFTAHCTARVRIDVPASTVLPPEIASFCSKVTAAVINASNEARDEFAAPKALQPGANVQGQDAYLEQVEQPPLLAAAHEPRSHPTGPITGQSATALIRRETSAVVQNNQVTTHGSNGPAQDFGSAMHPERAAALQEDSRSRRHSMEPYVVPEAKRMKLDPTQHDTFNYFQATSHHQDSFPRTKKKKNKGKKKDWQKGLPSGKFAYLTPNSRQRHLCLLMKGELIVSTHADFSVTRTCEALRL